jgi:hypothetical protein
MEDVSVFKDGQELEIYVVLVHQEPLRTMTEQIVYAQQILL